MYLEIRAEFNDKDCRAKFARMLGYAGFNTTEVGEVALAVYDGQVGEPVTRQIKLAADYEMEVIRAETIRRCLEVSRIGGDPCGQEKA